MPMLMHAVTARDRAVSLAELAKSTAASGRKNIVIAGALLDDAEAPAH
jgi:mannose/fructose-specific phosphotransferase system component IIA